MTISEFATELQKRMPDGVQIERIEAFGNLRGLVSKGGVKKYFTAAIDGPPNDALVERVAERIKAVLQ